MLDWKRIVPFGAEVSLDLSTRTPSDEDEIRALYARHHLLVFRNQSLDMDEQRKFITLFGPPLDIAGEGFGEITNEKVPGNVLADSALEWHSDLSFCPLPFDAISLQAVEVEDGRSGTRFVDGTLTYTQLPEDLKQRIAGREVLQVYGYNLAGRNTAALPAHLPRTAHPLAKPTGRDGEFVLYASSNQSAEVIGMAARESDDLLDALFAELYRPDRIYEHRWHHGDLVVWDNIAIQHSRSDIADVGVRRLQRAVAAPAGMCEQFPGFVPVTSALPDAKGWAA